MRGKATGGAESPKTYLPYGEYLPYGPLPLLGFDPPLLAASPSRSSVSMATLDPPPVTAPPHDRRSPPLPDAPPPVQPPPVPVPPVAPIIDQAHQLPAHRNKVGRVTDHAKGLVDDVKEWVEIRVELVRGEIEALIDSRVGALRGLIIVGVMAGITGLFALATLGLGLGALFGRRYWLGFLVVSLILALATWLAKRKFAPGKMRIEHSKSTGQLKISHDETPAQHEAKVEGRPMPKKGALHAE